VVLLPYNHWLFYRLCDATATREDRRVAFVAKKSTDSTTVMHWGHYNRNALLMQSVCKLDYDRKEEAMTALKATTSRTICDQIRTKYGWKQCDTLNIRLEQFGFDVLKDCPPDGMHLLVLYNYYTELS